MNSIAIVDERISQACERSLLCRGFNVIRLPASKNLSDAVRSHPDMLIFKHGNTLITSAEYCDTAAYVFSDVREFRADLKICFAADTHRPLYPQDAIFNALTVGDNLFCKTDTVSSAILDYAKIAGLTVRHVNQGYPACTVLSLGDRHAITSDEGMKRALECCGIAVTKIRNGGISLPPHEYGFIGGAAGVLGDKVYFLGNPDLHPDGEKITEACKESGFTPIALSDEPLADLGRILFL